VRDPVLKVPDVQLVKSKEGAVAGTDPAHALERRYLGIRQIGRGPVTIVSLMCAAFLVALALAAIVLVIFGVGERGTAIALRTTARWSFLLFLPAYAGGAIAWLWPRLNGLARFGRELGLAYASAQLVHVGLVLWIIHVAAGPSGTMVFFWIGIFCTYLLALFSLPRLQDALGPRLWRILRTIALEYIAIAFAADFVTLQSQNLGKHPLSYLPFALMLVSAAGLRFVAFWDRRLRPLRQSLSLRVFGPVLQSLFGRMFHGGVVGPAMIFITAIVVALALDDALWVTFESSLALYGPFVAVLGGYALFKSVVRAVSVIGHKSH
jgi:hypothetical protein